MRTEKKEITLRREKIKKYFENEFFKRSNGKANGRWRRKIV